MERRSEPSSTPEFSHVLRKHWGAAAVIALLVAIVAGFVAETAPAHARWISDPLTITVR